VNRGEKRILIVDDEEYFTALVKMSLEKINMYDVMVENKGARGLEAAKRFQPDLILLDLLMADM